MSALFESFSNMRLNTLSQIKIKKKNSYKQNIDTIIIYQGYFHTIFRHIAAPSVDNQNNVLLHSHPKKT